MTQQAIILGCVTQHPSQVSTQLAATPKGYSEPELTDFQPDQQLQEQLEGGDAGVSRAETSFADASLRVDQSRRRRKVRRQERVGESMGQTTSALLLKGKV